jgi:hypothetical protein
LERRPGPRRNGTGVLRAEVVGGGDEESLAGLPPAWAAVLTRCTNPLLFAHTRTGAKRGRQATGSRADPPRLPPPHEGGGGRARGGRRRG